MRPDIRFHPAALLAAARGRWRALFNREALDRDLDEEMRFHLEMEMEKNLRAGMRPGEARRRALLALGGVDRIAEEHRDARGTRLIQDAAADLRYAARSLARAPGFVATSVFTLAIAIGIGTVLFTGANGFFYRPLPVPGGADLVAIFTSDFNGYERFGASSLSDITDFASGVAPIAEVAGEGRVMLAVGTHENSVMAQGAIVSPGYFRMLRLSPALGHLPSASPPEFPAIVLSFTLWRRTFGADSSLIGRPLQVNGQPFIVMAVASPEFRGTSREIADDFWIDGTFAPLVLSRDDFVRSRGTRSFHVLARLRDGASLETLRSRLGVIASRLYQSYPDEWRDTTGNGRVITAMLERDVILSNISRSELFLVIGGVIGLGLGLLVIASANLASMQMARGAARRREIATRLALGAGRGRLVRQLLAECALVIVPGIIVGVAAAFMVSGLVSHYRPIPLPSIELSLDWRVLVYIAGALLLALLIFGLLPALQSVRSDLLTDLKGGGQPGAGGIRVGGLRGGLIIAQVALSVVFTATSGLVAIAIIRDASRSRGDARKVLITRVNFLPAAGNSLSVRALTDELIGSLARIPGVESASASAFIPVRGTRATVEAEIHQAPGEARRLILDANSVAPAYFRVLGLPILRGRDFETRDARMSNQTVIVSRAMADALWPSQDPIGKPITIGTRTGSASAEVIGVVADPIGQGPATAESFPGLLYLPMRPSEEADLVLYLRAPRGQSLVSEQAMQRLRAEQTRLIASEVMTLDHYYDRAVLPQRLLSQASGALAVLQMLLAVAGLSGLVAYVAALRRRDVGIRTALGASRRSILGLVMRQGIRLTAIGAAIGLALSLGASRAVAASLPVTTPMAVGSLGIAVVIFSATGAIAMLLPARRALDVAPAEALRLE